MQHHVRVRIWVTIAVTLSRPLFKFSNRSLQKEEILNRMDLTETNRNAQPTLSRCICGKTCKNQRGLKIHQSRMKCLEGGNREQRAGASPGKTEEVQGPESYHSAQSLQASVPLTLGKESRKKIKWPPANNKGA